MRSGGSSSGRGARQVLQTRERPDSPFLCLSLRFHSADAASLRTRPPRRRPPVGGPQEYYANNGKEFFLSFETPDRRGIYGFLKLRFNAGAALGELDHLPAEIRGACVIRWLQVCRGLQLQSRWRIPTAAVG